MGREAAMKRGHNFITLTAGEKKSWHDSLIPLREEWIKQQEARGFPAREFMDEMLSLINKYR